MSEDRRQHLEGYDPLAPANNAGHNAVCGSDGLCAPCLAYDRKRNPELWAGREDVISVEDNHAKHRLEEADDVDSLYIDYGGGS